MTLHTIDGIMIRGRHWLCTTYWGQVPIQLQDRCLLA